MILHILSEALSKELLITDEQIQKILDAFLEQLSSYLKKTIKISQVAYYLKSIEP
jgi:nucleoid DNA-binding protein